MQISARHLSKSFKVPIKEEGFASSFKYFFKRTYKHVHAVNDLSFNINKGELIGYLGPNGAGKSTTIKMLTGILVPDEGTITVNGLNPSQNRIQHVSDIGVVFGQKSQLWWDIPLNESFKLIQAIYKIPEKIYNEQFTWLIKGLGIDDYINRPVRMLSLGQRMRAELVASLLHKPSILFLDEPTIGLDATSKQMVRSFIKTLNQDCQTTVILTTHDMDDIEALANRVLIIDEGKLGFDGTLMELRQQIDNQRIITVDYLGDSHFTKHPNIHLQSNDNQKAIFKFNPSCTRAKDVIAYVSEGAEINDLLIENPPIEDIITKLYARTSK